MVLTNCIVARTSPGMDFSFVSPMNAHSSSRGSADRLRVDASDDCLKCLNRIPKAIGDFFSHRFADASMFWQACNSIGGNVTSEEIDRRAQEVFGFELVLNSRLADRRVALDRFNALSQQTRGLFYNVTPQYMQQFVAETDPERIESIRGEILRECFRVGSYQRTMAAVNLFFHRFSGGGAQTPVSSQVGQTTTQAISTEEESSHVEPHEFNWFEWLGSHFGYGGHEEHHEPVTADIPWWEHLVRRHHYDADHEGVSPDEVGIPVGPNVIRGVDVAVPDTVAYVKDRVPTAIGQRANEIARLKPLFEALGSPPAVPGTFNDPILFEIMTIPVFDASHPAVQSGLAALRTALDSGNAVSTVLNDQRGMRHTMEKDSLETHIAGGHSWAPAKCPQCRHPEHGGIKREFLRIDEGLQKEILTFLQRALPGR
jgi:hypothetical protein